MITSHLNCSSNIDTSLLSPDIIDSINFKDSNQNRGLNVRLLCGGDLLESFAVPGLWSEDDVSFVK